MITKEINTGEASENGRKVGQILDLLYKKYEYRGLIAYEKVFDAVRHHCDNLTLMFEFREQLVNRYSWAVPNQDALDSIATRSPHGLIEIGAGGGYWGYLLRQQMHLRCHLYDKRPEQSYRNRESITMWTQVLRGSVDKLEKWGSGKSLLLCWPCYEKSWAYECLLKWQDVVSPSLFYIGEGGGGCTGCDKFHELLSSSDNKYKLVDEVSIPSWHGIYDALYVYENENYEKEISSSKYLQNGYKKMKESING